MVLTALAPDFVALRRESRHLPSGALARSKRARSARVERPRSKLQATPPSELWTYLNCSLVFILALFSRSQRDSERGLFDSEKGRINAFVRSMMQPYSPETPKDQVVQRGIVVTIRDRILHWDHGTTIICGRRDCGKTMALRGMKGVC